MLKVLILLIVGVVVAGAVGLVALMATDSDSNSDSGTTGSPTPSATVGIVGTGATGATGGTGPTGPTAPAEVTAEEVLQRAVDRSASISSFHFVLTHENGTTPLPLSLELRRAEGDIIVPDRMRADVEARAAGINVNVRVVGIENRTWVTNPFTRQWQELPGTNIRDFADPAALVSAVLPSIREAELSSGGRVDGVDTRLVTGVIDSGVLQDSLGIAEPGHEVEVEVWIGADDDLPRRVRLTGPLSDEDSANVVRQVELSRFDQPVEIMPPE